MKDFPLSLNVKNKKNFPKVYDNRMLCYLRKEIYEHVIHKTENSYFELDKFEVKYTCHITDSMIDIIISELNVLGWNCKKTCANTALFIYSTPNPPSSCWDDGL